MTHFVTRTLLATLALFVFTVGHALADPIYFDVTGNVLPGNFSPRVPSGGGTASGVGNTYTHLGSPSAGIDVANIVFQSGGSNPTAFDTQPLTLSIALHDVATNAGGSLLFPGTFTGHIGGQIDGGFSADGTVNFAQTTQSLLLGNNRYTVSLNPQYSLAVHVVPRWSSGADYIHTSISAQVSAQPNTAPEPTSLTLAGIAVLSVLGGGLRHWCCQRAGNKPE